MPVRPQSRPRLLHDGGGFGDRTGHRPTLIAKGIASTNRAYGKHQTVFVIGDTVHDVAAAKANNAVAVAVATGTASQDELIAAGADIVLPTMETAMRFFRGELRGNPSDSPR